MASQFVRKITDTTVSEPIKETTTNGDLIITKDDKVLINLNGTLKDLTAGKDAEMPIIGGRNLLLCTSSDLKTKQVTNDFNAGPQATNGNYKIKVVSGQPYTYRAWLDNTNGPDNVYINVRFKSDVDSPSSYLGNGTSISKGGTGYSSLTFTPTKDGYVVLIPFATSKPQTFSAVWKEEKLEKGNTPTDWTPAPEDVPSNDAQLVHKTGNETVAGDKTFTGNTNLATTTMLAGNYGLRVTSSGFQKTTDGKTWVSANI